MIPDGEYLLTLHHTWMKTVMIFGVFPVSFEVHDPDPYFPKTGETCILTVKGDTLTVVGVTLKLSDNEYIRMERDPGEGFSPYRPPEKYRARFLPTNDIIWLAPKPKIEFSPSVK